MSYNLFLDDVRMPVDVGNYFNPVEYRKLFRREQWVIVRNYEDFIKHIKENGIPEIVSLDHDLEYIVQGSNAGVEINDENAWYYAKENKEAKTGYDCAKWMIEYCNKMRVEPKLIMCHSMNPVGKENILNLFR